jgi:predicted ATPase/class 3 adenylate cyclase
MTSLPAGTVTFMFTDVEGSTKLLQRLGQDEFAENLDIHIQMLRDAVRRADGIEIRTEGDALFAVFATAPSALSAAVAAQHALQGHVWPADAEFRVRMGLHTGTGTLGGDDYVGIDVHRAARIADCGHGGQIVVSAATAEIVVRSLPEGVTLNDLGRHALKDVGLEHLFGVRIEGLRTDFPPLRSTAVRHADIPARLTRFVGRRGEVDAVADLLGERRLVTLTGPGGTGKTRLALEVAGAVATRFEDGLWFVPLAQISDPGLVATTILDRLGLRSHSVDVDPVEHLAGYVGPRSALLVLDNFEHVIDAAGVVGRILTGGTGVRVLATSRVPLHLAGEQEVPVPPLSVTAGNGATSESYDLFVDRARSSLPDYTPSTADAEAIIALTSRLEGLPLAIELAASRINVLSPVAMLDRLDISLLASRRSDMPTRQQTMAATIRWSYDLLEPDFRILFEDFSVFAGGATLEEIEAVCTLDVGITLDGLELLVENGLVRRIEVSTGLRFGMLYVIEEFARQALAARGDDPELRDRHLEAFLDLVERAAPHLSTHARVEWLGRLTEEHDNIRAAIEWAIAQERGAVAQRLVAGMWRFWQTRGPLQEAKERIARALALDGDDPLARAAALAAAGGIAYWQGDFAATVEPYTQAVDILRREGNAAALAEALYNLSFALIGCDRHDDAASAVEESMDISRSIDDPFGVARAQWGRFNLEWYRGNTDMAVRHAEEAVRAFEDLDAPVDFGWACFATSDGLMRLGEVGRALEYLDRALPGFFEAGDLSALILFLVNYGTIEMIVGHRDRGARLFGAAESLKEKTGITLFDSVMWNEPNREVKAIVGEMDDTVAAAYREGRRMPEGEAVALALNRPDDYPEQAAPFASDSPNLRRGPRSRLAQDDGTRT